MSNIDTIAVQPAPADAHAITPGLWQIDRGSDGLVVVRGTQPSGNQTPEPADWRDRLAWFTANIPGVKMAGAKRFFPDGNSGANSGGHVFSLGEFVVHPKGFHHHGKGVDGKCYRFPEECDTIAGGVAVIDEQTFDAIDGQHLLESLGQLGMLGLGLAVRRHGARILAIPQVGVVDTFSPSLNDAESAAFESVFGFNWVAPDLDKIREDHAGGGLLWNAYFHAGMMPFEKYDQRGAMHWESYEKADVFRQRADHLAKLAAQFTLQPDGVGGIALDIGAGDGLFSHLIAMQGCEVVGIDPETQGIAQAKRMCEQQTYPQQAGTPRFIEGFGDQMPFDNNSAACACLFDVIEHLANPIGVLNEVARVLKPGGHLICVTPAWQYGTSSDPIYHGYEYNLEELNRQIKSAPGMQLIHNGQIGGVYRDLVVVARKAV